MKYSDFFIAIYIHECKSYCDEKFFNALFNSDIGDAHIEIVDNSKNENYSLKLRHITQKNVTHIKVSRDNEATQFIRNVAESLDVLRTMFLQSNCKYFVTLEADVVPPEKWLHYFMEVKHLGDIIGGIYYDGFHGKEFFQYDNIIQTVPCILSGCTLYKREIIEKFPFRWSIDNVNAFPDGWMSYDARHAGYRLINYSKIKCQHLTKDGSDSRGFEDIN